MAAENRLTLERARESRDRVIAALSDHFAHDLLDVDEFERRVALAQTSESAQEIDALLADLPAPATTAIAAQAPRAAALVPAGEVRDTQSVTAILGGVDRRGVWSVPRRLRVKTMMGGVQLDFREARLPPGPVDIEVTAFMGGVNIIVPPGLAVETHGTAIMGGFQEVNRAPPHPDAGAPLLRVHGLVVMGGVAVQMMLPGENERDSHRRLRNEARDKRRELRDQRHQDRHEERREQRALRSRDRDGDR